MQLNSSVCLVTGAGRGIGRQIATELVRAGAKVIVCDRDEDAYADFHDEAVRNAWDMHFSPCDVSREESVTSLFSTVVAPLGQLDVLVNNAGITRDNLLVKIKDSEVTRMSLADFQQVLNVNLTGVFLCAREAAAMMIGQNRGVIINLSSVSRAGNFGQTNYSAAKAGVDAMTVTWSKELARYGIRVAAVAPGYINTEMVAAMSPQVLEKIVSQVPLRRLGEMTEIAKTVRFIIENDFVNGKVLEVDGGLRV